MKGVAVQWSLNLVVLESSTLAAISQIAVIHRLSRKRLALSVQAGIKDKLLNEKPSVIVSSMVAIAIQNVNSLLGTSLLAEIVQNVETSSWRKKSVVAVSKSFVAMAITKKKKSNKRTSPESKFQALFSKGLTKFLTLWETSS